MLPISPLEFLTAFALSFLGGAVCQTLRLLSGGCIANFGVSQGHSLSVGGWFVPPKMSPGTPRCQ